MERCILFLLMLSFVFKGNISLARELNRETLDGYSLVVVASKDGKQAVGYVSSY